MPDGLSSVHPNPYFFIPTSPPIIKLALMVSLAGEGSGGNHMSAVDAAAAQGEPGESQILGQIQAGPAGAQECNASLDYDEESRPFWDFVCKKARSRDKVRTGAMQNDMRGIMLFVNPLCIILAMFVKTEIDKQPPSTATNPVPSTPPSPLLSPSASNNHATIFYTAALFLGLFSLLLENAGQTSARELDNVYVEIGRDPLKIARLRQYRHEGAERWHIFSIPRTVSVLRSITLTLYIIGFVQSLLHVDTKLDGCAIALVGAGIVLYISITFEPIIDPQFPHQNSMSSSIWRIFCGRWYGLTDRQVQIAMEGSEERKRRDADAIRELIDDINMTDGAEMEQLIMVIPGSFNTVWGVVVWKEVDKTRTRQPNLDHQPGATRLIGQPTSGTGAHHPPTHVAGNGYLHKLSAGVARFAEKRENRGRKCTRACVETIASLVLCTDINITWFGDLDTGSGNLVKLLEDIGTQEKLRGLSFAGTDKSFVIRWTCLSLVVAQRLLESNELVRGLANAAAELLLATGDLEAIDGELNKARDYLCEVHRTLNEIEDLVEAKRTLRNSQLASGIIDLESINIAIEAGNLENLDRRISETQASIARQITFQIPGVPDDLDTMSSFSHFVERFRDPRRVQFICPGKSLGSMCSVAQTLRRVLQGEGNTNEYDQLRKDLREHYLGRPTWHNNEVRQQLWRLEDLRDGHGFGFIVELFFISLSTSLSTFSLKNSHVAVALYTGTFRVITSGWSKHTDSHGTRRLLLSIPLSRSEEFQDEYPEYIVDEYLTLIGNFFKRQNTNIDDDLEQLESFKHKFNSSNPFSFWSRLRNTITSVQTA